MYEKPDSEWTTFEKILKFMGDHLFDALFIFGIIDTINKYSTGQRGLIFSAIWLIASIWALSFSYDIDAQKYGWGKYKNKKKS